MHVRMRAITVTVASAVVLAASGFGAATAFGASGHHAVKNAVTFSTAHVAGARGQVLVEGKGLVVYTFTGDKPGHAATCTGQCAVIWPPLKGTPVLAHGVKIKGKFGTIHGQITFNGMPLYLFIGEKSKANHADSAFKVVQIKTASNGPGPGPGPSPAPTPSYSGPPPPPPSPMPTPSYTPPY